MRCNTAQSSAYRLSPGEEGAAKRRARESNEVASGPWPVVRCFLLATAAIVLPVSPLFAQQRPLLTEDPRPIRAGSLVTETGFAYLNRVRFPVSGLGGNQFSFLDGSFNFGLAPNVEFQTAGTIQNYLKVREGGSGRRNDWGDGVISTKIRIVEETRTRPIITFRPTVVLPNASATKGLGTDGTHFYASVLAGKSVGPAFVFGNVGLGLLDDAVRPAAQQDVLTYGIAALVRVFPRVRFAAEWTGVENPQDRPSPGGEDRGQVRLGFQFLAGSTRFDIGAVSGTTRLDARAGLVFGVTKEFRLWR